MNGKSPDRNHTLLAVLAHPDDESFGMGGTLALYARRGAAVHLACATRGEVGEVSPELLEGFNSIADLRVSELDSAEEMVVFCKGGTRSARALELLASAGFRKVKNLKGGINAWAKDVDPRLPIY